MAEKVVLMLDGGFLKKKLEKLLGHFPTPDEVANFCQTIMAKPALNGTSLFRIYYYDAPPFEGRVMNPISRVVTNFSTLSSTRRNKALTDTLELKPNFAVRRGVLNEAGWKLGNSALRNISANPRQILAGDLVPNLNQKV